MYLKQPFTNFVFISPVHSVLNRDTINVFRFTTHQNNSRPGFQMDLIPYGGGVNPSWDMGTYLASFEKSQEWEILENSTERYERSKDVGVLLKFSEKVALKFTLEVKRRPGYTTHLLMLPCVFLGSMTVIVFCLPPERPDRHTLGKYTRETIAESPSHMGRNRPVHNDVIKWKHFPRY